MEKYAYFNVFYNGYESNEQDTYMREADGDGTVVSRVAVSYNFASFLLGKPWRSKHETMGHMTWLVKERVAVAGARSASTHDDHALRKILWYKTGHGKNRVMWPDHKVLLML